MPIREEDTSQSGSSSLSITIMEVETAMMMMMIYCWKNAKVCRMDVVVGIVE